MYASNEPLLVSIEDAAALLSIGRTSFYELRASGVIRVVYIGRSVRVPMSALREYVQDLEANAA
jgi:excisionase family DNA binding protein